MFVLPALTPVTTPALLTFATEEFSLAQVTFLFVGCTFWLKDAVSLIVFFVATFPGPSTTRLPSCTIDFTVITNFADFLDPSLAVAVIVALPALQAVTTPF